ncbi:hypothetical protein MHYP_G00262720 [Metynnis hypsauchen]
MGVEDWETKYKLNDTILDDYLEPEQKTWDDDDESKSEIYRIVSSPGDSKGSRFYQTVECDAVSPETEEYNEAGNSIKRSSQGSGDVRLVYKEAGSFEDETSPPEISIIPSVRQVHQQNADGAAYKEGLLYKTRMWAKNSFEDTLENYTIYREEEEARMRARSEYGSVGSDEMQFSLGSEEELDDMTFVEEDGQYEYDSYYNSRRYISSYGEWTHSYYERKGIVSTRGTDSMLSPVEEPNDEYIDTMNELQKIVDTVSEYLAGREEEISKYEEMQKSGTKPETSDKDKDKELKSDEVNDENAVEQGITGVKNAVTSLISSIAGNKSTAETTETTETTATTTQSPAPPQPESGFSKLLSFIPKSSGSPTPVAVVPPAHQEPSADKKFSLQSLLPFQSSEPSRPASVVSGAEATESLSSGSEPQGSSTSQPQTVVDSVLGRLSPFRLFDKPAGESTSQPASPNRSQGSTETKEGSIDQSKSLSLERSGSQHEHQSSLGGSGSGSVELLPESESSGEIPDVLPRETSLKQGESKIEANPPTQTQTEDTGFFSPFKKSLTSLMSTTPAPADKPVDGSSTPSVFSIFKPSEVPKTEDAAAAAGNKLKLPFFFSDTPATSQAPKQEGGMLSGFLKLATGEDTTTSQPAATSPLTSRAALLESVPKGNSDTGWFSNLFRAPPAESPKQQIMTPAPSKPSSATKNIPTVVVAPEKPEEIEDASAVSRDVPQEECQNDTILKPETDSQSDTQPNGKSDTKKEPNAPVQSETQTDTSSNTEVKPQDRTQTTHQEQAKPQTEQASSKAQGLLSGLLPGASKPDQPQQGGLLSGLFSSVTMNETQSQQGTTSQSTGLFSGLLKMATPESVDTSNQPAGTQREPVPSGNQLSKPSPAGADNQPQKTTVPPQGGGLLSGLFKLASDTISNPPATAAQQAPGPPSSQPDQKSATTEELTQGAKQGAAPPSQQGLLSGLLKLANPENVSATGHAAQAPQQQRPGTCDGQQSNQHQKQTNTQSEPPPQQGAPTQTQSGGLFGGLLKLTESALAPSGTQQTSDMSNRSSQQSVQPPPAAPTGGMLSGFLNKIAATENISQQHQPPADGQMPNQGPKPSQQAAPSQQGGFLSGLFGISSLEVNTANQASPQNAKQPGPTGPGNQPNVQQTNRQNQVPPQQAQASGPGGMLSGLFNKIADTAAATSQVQPSGQPGQNQNAPQQPPPGQQGGFLSGLFSSNNSPAQQQQNPSGARINQNQQQGNRQPLQRQNHIPSQPAAAPEPQQGGLFSGLLNKLASVDTPTPQSGAGDQLSQQAKKPAPPGQSPASSSQPPPPNQSGGILSGLLKIGADTSAPKQSPGGQQQQPSPSAQQSKRQGPQGQSSPQGPQQQGQSGGLFSTIFKMATSDESQQQQEQANAQPGGTSTQGSNAQQNESGGILSGFLSKLTTSTEDQVISQVPADQKPQKQDRPSAKTGQNRPQIQRAKPVEQEPTLEGGNEKEQKTPQQKGFLSGLFSKGSEEDALSKLKEVNAPPSVGTGTPSGVFKAGSTDSTSSATNKESEKGFLSRLLPKHVKDEAASLVTSTSGLEPSTSISQTQQTATANLHPAVKSTQQYMEEVHKLLYGTANEYGYQDLLHLFTQHGVIPAELYEHQCLIEALLWQQLNDYALSEALSVEAQECYTGNQEGVPLNNEAVIEEPGWWNLKNIDPRQFHIPSHPWRDVTSSSFQNGLPPADREDTVIFDMSNRNGKPWSSCDNLDNFCSQRSRKPWIEKDSVINLSRGSRPAKLTRCQSLSDCSTYGRPTVNNKDRQFDTTFAMKIIKRLTSKKGPMDLTPGAVDLSSTAGHNGDLEDDRLFEDSEWYQQWLLLLEQGMWWPAEAGDCGYFIYADEEYIYSLLTDRDGKHLYAYATPEDSRVLKQITENISNMLQKKDDPKATLCGFKIPLVNEDEALGLSGQHQARSSVLSAPVDLSSALLKGDRIMNMNFERFSQMFQESIGAQTEQPMDFSVHKLKKVKIGVNEPNEMYLEEHLEASDLTNKTKKTNHGGPYWKNQGIKDLFPEASVTGMSSTVTGHTSPVTYKQKTSTMNRSPIPEIKIAHVDDTVVQQQRPEHNQKASSILSTVGGFVGKTKDAEPCKIIQTSSTTSTSPLISKTIPQLQTACRKLPDVPVSSSRASTTSVRSLPATSGNIVTQGNAAQIVTASSSSALPRPRLGRQPSLSAQSSTLLKTSRVDGAQSSVPCELQQTPEVVIPNERRPLPPPQNLLYNRPEQALDSLLSSKPMDFSGALRKKEISEDTNTAVLSPNVRNGMPIEDVFDFTKSKKVKKEQQTADIREGIGVDLTVEIEEIKEINMTFPALEVTILSPRMSEVPLMTVSAPPSLSGWARYYPPDSGLPSPDCRTEQQTSTSPAVKSQPVRQGPVELSQTSTTPEISGRKPNISPKHSPKAAVESVVVQSSQSKADSGKDQQVLARVPLKIATIDQVALSSQPTSPEIRRSATISPKSKISAQNKQTSLTRQSSFLSESMRKVISSQTYSESTAPANSIKGTLDMSSKSVFGQLDKPTDETKAVPLVRRRRSSVVDITDDSYGVPLIVEPPTSEVKRILPKFQSQSDAVTSEVPPLKTHHLSRQTYQTSTALSKSMQTTLDMSSKPVEEPGVPPNEAVSLVRRRSISTSSVNEELSGVSLVIDSLKPKLKPPLRRYQSQPQAECSHKVVDINSPKSSVLHCQNTRFSRATSLPVQSSQPHQTATAPANAIKATLDMSAKTVSDTAEGPLFSNSEALPLAPSIIITQIEQESQGPFTVTLSESEIPKKEAVSLKDDSLAFGSTTSITEVVPSEPEVANIEAKVKDKILSFQNSDATKPKEESREDSEVSSVYSPEHLTHKVKDLPFTESFELQSPEKVVKQTEQIPTDLNTTPVMSSGDQLSISEGLEAELQKTQSAGTPVANTEALPKEEISASHTGPPNTDAEEQSSKGIFSLFGGSSSAPSQTQSGSSILGSILPSSSTSKETPSTGLFSMFGGGSPQSTSAPTPKEAPGKGLFSMFSGGTTQPQSGSQGPPGFGSRCPPGSMPRGALLTGPRGTPGLGPRGAPGPWPRGQSGPGPRGPPAGGPPPRGPPPKESQGKGLFSMFSGPTPQTASAATAPPKPPASASSILGGILPGSSTPKDNTGSGLFSMFGGPSAQSSPAQTIPALAETAKKEQTGKGLLSMFGGPSPPESSESESMFKVASVFSLGGGSDKPKSSGFGLLSFMDDKKTGELIPEDTATPKEESSFSTTSHSLVTDGIKDVTPPHKKMVEAGQDLPDEPVSAFNEEHVSTVITDESVITEDAGIAENKISVSTELTHHQITVKPESEAEALTHPPEEQPQEQSTFEAEKALVEKMNTDEIKSRELEVDTDKETGKSVDSLEPEKHSTFDMVGEPFAPLHPDQELEVQKLSEADKPFKSEKIVEPEKSSGPDKHLESVKPIELEQLVEADRPLELDKSVDSVGSAETDEVAESEGLEESGTIEETQKQGEVEKSTSKPDNEGDHTRLKNEPYEVEIKQQDETEKQLTEGTVEAGPESEKSGSGTDKDADHTKLPKKETCESLLEEKVSESKQLARTENQLTELTAQAGPEPQPTAPIQQQPQSTPEIIGPPGPHPGLIGPSDQPRPRMPGPTAQPRPVMQGPRSGMSGEPRPRIQGPRPGMAGQPRPRMVGPQRPPEPAGFSGFMSMFSGSSASSKPASSSFFSTPQTSFFKSSTATGPQQQQKTSFFNLPTSLPTGLPTESLTGDLFGLFKGTDAAKPEDSKSAAETCKSQTENQAGTKHSNEPGSPVDKESSTVNEPEATTLPTEKQEQELTKDNESVEESKKPNIMSAEEAKDRTSEITNVSTEEESEKGVLKEGPNMTIKEEPEEPVMSPKTTQKVDTEETHPTSPPAKGMFDLPGLSAPSFGGLLSGAAETAKPFSSLFGSSTPASSDDRSQQQPDSGGLFSGLKGLSAGLFQEEKPAATKEEPMSAASMFGKKIGFPWQSTPPQTPPAVVTTPSKPAELKSDDGYEAPETDKLSPESDVTESADPSDVEGPSDISSDKQQSFDMGPESPVALKQDSSSPDDKTQNKPQAKAAPPPEDKDKDATDHGQLPESHLSKELDKRLVGI